MRQIGTHPHRACPAGWRQPPAPAPAGGPGAVRDSSVVALARRAAALASPLPCSQNPRLWFSDRPAELELAKKFCQPCPLRGPCLAGAVERAEPVGVWGGEIFERGVVIAYKRPRGRPPGPALTASRAARGAA
jgi:WhiB family redox-sensing transcriptional regulator